MFLSRLRLRYLLSGGIVIMAISAIYGLSLFKLWQQAPLDLSSFFQDSYLHHVIWFSFYQALLSSFLSVVFGIVIARAFFYQHFWGKTFLLKLFSLTFVLPSLVIVFGVIGVYGRLGWLAKLAELIGWQTQMKIYGLHGILLAHLLFNIPLASRLFLQSLYQIPYQQRQLASQLHLRYWQFFRWVEFPFLRQQLLPTFALIFMLCFTSFATVLTLGGGPEYTTLEVAIFQAITFEFDLPKAAFYALIQLFICFILFSLTNRFTPSVQSVSITHVHWQDKLSLFSRMSMPFIITITCIFVLSPLVLTLYEGLTSPMLWQSLINDELWKAFLTSILMAPLAALFSVLLSVLLLFTIRRLQWKQLHQFAQTILSLGMVVLAIPTLVLSMGLFLLLQEIELSHYALWVIVILCNGLMAMPFVLKVLHYPMLQNLLSYETLCQSLGICGWQRIKLIELPPLYPSLRYAFALACTLSLGDFTAIALFGHQDFTSLPYLLYSQLGHYRQQQAAVTALVLLLLCVGLFWFIERNKTDDLRK